MCKVKLNLCPSNAFFITSSPVQFDQRLRLKHTRRCKKLNESSMTMHTVSDLHCINDDSKSCGFLYPLQHNHSECYHQSQLNRTGICKKLNKSSIIMHTVSEVCCIHDNSKSF